MVYAFVAVGVVVGFVVGLLVGRKNPSLADAAAKVVKEAQAKAAANVPSVTDQVVAAVKGAVPPAK